VAVPVALAGDRHESLDGVIGLSGEAVLKNAAATFGLEKCEARASARASRNPRRHLADWFAEKRCKVVGPLVAIGPNKPCEPTPDASASKKSKETSEPLMQAHHDDQGGGAAARVLRTPPSPAR